MKADSGVRFNGATVTGWRPTEYLASDPTNTDRALASDKRAVGNSGKRNSRCSGKMPATVVAGRVHATTPRGVGGMPCVT
jgi:hypothetical protein